MEKHFPLQSLVDDNYEELKMISTLDFNIFNLKKKIGYSNVLPLMGYTMLQTLGLVNNKIISTKKLESFLNAVSDNYKITTLYHNSIHGADVTQTLLVFCLNSNVEEICETTVLDLLGMILSSIGHDLGHPGLNNGYHINASTELGITYNDISCLENFHSAFLFKIIRKEENNILEKFSVQNYKTIRKRMISQILATDMAKHGEICSPINSKIKTRKDQERFIFLSGNDKSKFDEQLLELNHQMIEMGNNIISSIQKAIEALVAKDVDQAKLIMDGDAEIDHLQKVIESICFNLLIQQQPVARDLRTVTAAMKMVTDMERIGDHATNIAEWVIYSLKQKENEDEV